MPSFIKIGLCMVVYFLFGHFPISAQERIPPKIIVEVVDNDKIFILHTVKENQTLYSICKFYNTGMSDVLLINQMDNAEDIQRKEILRVPFNKAQFKLNTAKGKQFLPVHYAAKTKETLYTIAKKYFDQDVDHLCARNGITDYKLDLNQDLIVGYFDTEIKQKTNFDQPSLVFKKIFEKSKLEQNNRSDSNSSISSNSLGKDKADSLVKVDSLEIEDALDIVNAIKDTGKLVKIPAKTAKVTRKGIAFWDKKKINNSNTLLVLHNDASPNSQIKIKNTLTGMEVFATVAGEIPKNLYRKNIDCIISPAVAKKIGALDSKFQIVMTYSKGE